jgi:hypothetical protein
MFKVLPGNLDTLNFAVTEWAGLLVYGATRR